MTTHGHRKDGIQQLTTAKLCVNIAVHDMILVNANPSNGLHVIATEVSACRASHPERIRCARLQLLLHSVSQKYVYLRPDPHRSADPGHGHLKTANVRGSSMILPISQNAKSVAGFTTPTSKIYLPVGPDTPPTGGAVPTTGTSGAISTTPTVLLT